MAGPVPRLSGMLACAAVAAALPLSRLAAAEAVETALSLAPDAPARLVLAYWPEQGWIVRQDGRQVELALPGARLDIDPPSLPATAEALKTLSVETASGATYLRIGLGCDCTLAVQGDGQRLMIDVVGADLAAGPIRGDASSAPRLAPAPVRRPATATSSAPDILPGTPPDIEVIRDRLLGELRRAAESGLVTLRPEPGQVSGAHPSAEPAATAQLARAAMPEPPVRVGTEAPSRLVAGPAPADPPHPPQAPGPDLPPASPPAAADASAAAERGPECLANEVFRLPDPREADALIRDISGLRRAMIGEFDRADPGAVENLARLYIAHGLGIEALGLLEEMGSGVPDRPVLAALATLTDDRALPDRNILDAPGCAGQHALWQAFDAALAGRNAEALRFEAAATGALEQMARGVRGRISAHVGLAGAAMDDRIAVHRLLAMARRAVPEADAFGRDLVRLLAAEDDRLHGDAAGRLAKLEQLRGGRSAASESALLALAGHVDASADGAPADIERMRLDLGALALAARGTRIGEAALIAEIRLTAGTLGRDMAFELLEHGRRDGTLSEPAYRTELSALAARPAQPGDTDLALVHDSDPGRFAGSLGDRGFRRALARSYAGLGAPTRAEAVLLDGDLDDTSLVRDIARAYLGGRDIDRALELAALLPDGPERSGIIAGAALATGDHPAALPALVAAHAPPEQRAAAAWFARDWEAMLAALDEADWQPRAESAEPSRPERIRRAARLAYGALRAGRAEVPAEARALLADEPAVLGGLEAMFARLAPELAARAPVGVPGFSARLTEEHRMLEALLDDG